MAEQKKRLLIVCVDRDNDLQEKTKISGPVIGRAANLEAATKLALADPEETDANAIFEAIKIFDSLAKKQAVQIVTLTGDRRLGYQADKEVGKQLERVLHEYPAESCIFVSDGADDQQVLPLVSSRMKIDSIRLVVMRQSKELEKTYFLLLEKLKEPYYARIILGIPALILLGLAISEFMGLGWKPVVMVIGLYLLAKGFGFEENIFSSFSELKFSVENISLVVYIAAIPLFLISLWLGFQSSTSPQYALDPVKSLASTIRSTLLLLPWAAMLVLAGKVLDLLREGRKLETLKYGLYAITIVLLWLLFSVASDWVLADRYFSDFVATILTCIILAFVAVEGMKYVRAGIAASLKLENKEAISEIGAYLGKIVGVDRKNGLVIVQTPLGQKLSYPFETISSVAERVVIQKK